MSLSLSLFFAIGMTSVWPVFAAEVSEAPRVRVCSITLNSKDEREVFKAELKPASRYEFIELVPNANSGRGWFDDACARVAREKISCDVLLVSGHFGGDLFFGADRNSGNRLFMEDLERHSCAKSCAGILSDPSKIFLFGCNTLAGKDADHRTRSEYVDALIHGGMGRLDAERVADSRYGPFGGSFRDQMARIFAGSHEVLGFDSAAPSGRHLAPALREFLGRVSSGGRTFEEVLRSDEAQAAFKKFQGSFGPAYRSVLSNSCFHPAYLPMSLLEEDLRKGSVRQDLCKLGDSREWYSTRINRMSELMGGKDAQAFLPSMQVFFRQHPPRYRPDGPPAYEDLRELDSLEKLARHKPAGLDAALAQIRPGYSRFQLALLAYQAGWIGGASGTAEIVADLRAAWGGQKPWLDPDSVDYLCQVAPSLPPEVGALLVSPGVRRIRSERLYPRLRQCLRR